MRFTEIGESYDLVVIGGGITGAGILREAVRAGLRTLLVERRDFAWGTSSRSSKLVHGGLRYLKEGKIFLTMDSVRERVRLIHDAPGLVEPLGFLWPSYKGKSPGKNTLGLGLMLYDLMTGRRQHKFFPATDFFRIAPHVNPQNLIGGFQFEDAQVDDARLVLRLIFEARARGGAAVGYAEAVGIERNQNREVVGITLRDTETGQTKTVATRGIVNATGFWAETLHPSPVSGLHLRPLRGSHLVFPFWRLPLGQAVSFTHPDDRRPIFAIPWEGATILGTTDLDHHQDANNEPAIEAEEADYLLKGAQGMFPELNLRMDDCVSTWAGVRPVLSSGPKDPSKESREHVVWVDKGLVTITGGKLTTFRLLALDALKAVSPFLTKMLRLKTNEPVFAPPICAPTLPSGLTPMAWRRLSGRYGSAAQQLLSGSVPGDFELVPGTNTMFAEIRHAAATEDIRHLADLLLRRVRVGFLLAGGGMEHMDRIREICAPVLPWDAATWDAEIALFKQTWNAAYCPPMKKECGK
ncbi:MAG: glycerol-3-phosphate dehydrogenase/oxidase [Thermodesulfobacteriota bacterium]